MSEIYDATYNAVRSRISHCDLDSVFQRWLNSQSFDWKMANKIEEVGNEQMRPSVLLRPSISRDGDQWCVLYGENLHDGIAGFGKTPIEAFSDFDNKYFHDLTIAPKDSK